MEDEEKYPPLSDQKAKTETHLCPNRRYLQLWHKTDRSKVSFMDQHGHRRSQKAFTKQTQSTNRGQYSIPFSKQEHQHVWRHTQVPHERGFHAFYFTNFHTTHSPKKWPGEECAILPWLACFSLSTFTMVGIDKHKLQRIKTESTIRWFSPNYSSKMSSLRRIRSKWVKFGTTSYAVPANTIILNSIHWHVQSPLAGAFVFNS